MVYIQDSERYFTFVTRLCVFRLALHLANYIFALGSSNDRQGPDELYCNYDFHSNARPFVQELNFHILENFHGWRSRLNKNDILCGIFGIIEVSGTSDVCRRYREDELSTTAGR
jgi:hypothetical protein